MSQPKLVIVTGGVCSSLGKGIAAASLGRLLVDRGLRIRNMKLDPYLNGNPGTMAPSEHGEVFVTVDGAECDLDLGSYERFTGVPALATASAAAGDIYWTVLTAERHGEYLGHTVQAVPHITAEILRRIDAAGHDVDVVIVEIGGTVGDIEIQVFLEAVRQLRNDRPDDVCNLHLTLVPEVGPSRELKTKPSQHSVAMMRSYGLNPDVLIARSTRILHERVLTKLALACGVTDVISAPDATSIYTIPGHLATVGLDDMVCGRLGLVTRERDSSGWEAAVAAIVSPPEHGGHARVALVAKYNDGHDTYVSVIEAVRHAYAAAGTTAEVVWVDAEQLEDGNLDVLGTVNGIIVPGGFGHRGVEGKIAAATYARVHNVPYLGLCLGLQVACVAAARNVTGFAHATSAEWETQGPQIITLLDSQHAVTDKSATMRLGTYEAVLGAGTTTAAAYGLENGGTVSERHRHRYEVNPEYIHVLEQAGVVISGRSPDGSLVDHIEDTNHRFYVGTQAHPEFGSRPGHPHPLFAAFAAATLAT